MSQQTLAPLDLPVATFNFASTPFVAAPLSTNVVSTTSAGGAFTVSLPDASTMVGRALVVFFAAKYSSDDVTIAQVSGQNINASSSNLTLSSANTAYTLLAVPDASGLNGAGWLALSGLLAQ